MPLSLTDSNMRLFSLLYVSMVLLLCLTNTVAKSQESARVTPTVKLIAKIEPCLVTIFAKTDNAFGIGSGSFIHPDGYILTNFHVVQRFDGFVVLPNGDVAEYRYIGGVPERDIAIVKANLNEPAQPILLGRSHDIRNGEPVISAGNPGGRGTVFSSGIVSSKGIMTDASNVLMMSQFRGSVRDLAIQFDAASNRGNSGGPLVNADGEQIGVVASKNFEEENINFAIPIDRVRMVVATALAAEPRRDIYAGVTVDYLAATPTVVAVATDSPASAIGLQAGDILKMWNDKPLVTGIDWDLMLVSANADDAVELSWSRDSVIHTETLKLARYRTSWPSSSLEVKPDRLEVGLTFQTYHLTNPSSMPDFSTIAEIQSGSVEDLDLAKLKEVRNDNFAVVYEGYIQIEKPGVYRLSISSDDGSKLYLNGSLFIDHDGNHPAYERGRIERFVSGYHRVRIEYFQGAGGKSLSLALVETEMNKLMPMRFYHDRKD